MSEDERNVVGADQLPPMAAGVGESPDLAHGWRRWRVPALAAVAVAGMVGTIGFGVAWAGLQSRESDQAAAKASATRFLLLLTNFDAPSVDRDFQQINDMATGQFATQAKQVFNSRTGSQLQAAGASTRGQIRYVYMQSWGNDQASVYALVDQTFANATTKGPQVDQLRLVVDLNKVSGVWKISAVTDLGAGAVSVAPPSPTTTAKP